MGTKMPQTRAPEKYLKIWLFLTAAAIFLMVLIGGATRLTESGLSITQWQPIGGAIPPLSDADWQDLFARYQATAQYHLLNHGMTLPEFKGIFWWEYAHRLWGRLIGFVVGIPLIYLLWRRHISWAMGRRLLVIFALGAAQGFVGWWMVKSGLAGQAWVSPVRLAFHLGLAVVIYGLVLQIYFELGVQTESPPVATRDGWLGLIILALSFITILAGALVAGLHAGLIYNEFPLMGGRFVPEDYWQVDLPFTPINFLMNASQNPAAAQFHHRILAESLAVLALIWAHMLYRQSASPKLKRAALYVMAAVVVQIALGICTLLFSVPVLLGVMHQAGALALFTAIFYAATCRRGQFV